MRLLLDEHFSPAIADELRSRGHDVLAVAAIQELRQCGDSDLLTWATEQGRALVTENVADFVALHRQALSRGERHGGIVVTSPHRFPRSTAGVGALVAALDELLHALPDDDALATDLRWLR